jgi:hypothetical protein
MYKNLYFRGKHYVNLDDHVVVKGERTGYIRYIGHLDIKIGQPNMVFVGIELDAPGKCSLSTNNGRQAHLVELTPSTPDLSRRHLLHSFPPKVLCERGNIFEKKLFVFTFSHERITTAKNMGILKYYQTSLISYERGWPLACRRTEIDG